jgi:hypothetical protein
MGVKVRMKMPPVQTANVSHKNSPRLSGIVGADPARVSGG